MSTAATRRTAANAAWLLVSGISIGWLAGLSVSPVLATVLSSLLAAMGGVIAGMQTVEKRGDRGQVATAAPVALLLLGVAVAAPVGVMVRTHCFLEKGGECPPDASAPAADQSHSLTSLARVGGLFNSLEKRQHWCDETLRAPDETLANTIRRTGDQFPWMTEIADSVESAEQLRRIVEAMCGSY